jgi:hypothetical protein
VRERDCKRDLYFVFESVRVVCYYLQILIEGCRKCTISLDKITVQTATIEMWRCSDTDMFIDCYVGTLQA